MRPSASMARARTINDSSASAAVERVLDAGAFAVMPGLFDASRPRRMPPRPEPSRPDRSCASTSAGTPARAPTRPMATTARARTDGAGSSASASRSAACAGCKRLAARGGAIVGATATTSGIAERSCLLEAKHPARFLCRFRRRERARRPAAPATAAGLQPMPNAAHAPITTDGRQAQRPKSHAGMVAHRVWPIRRRTGLYFARQIGLSLPRRRRSDRSGQDRTRQPPRRTRSTRASCSTTRAIHFWTTSTPAGPARRFRRSCFSRSRVIGNC